MQGINASSEIVHLSAGIHTACELNFINSWLKERDRKKPRTVYFTFYHPPYKARLFLWEQQIWFVKSLFYPV